VNIFFISACRLYYDQIYDCNLEISPTQAILKRNCKKLVNAFKSYKPSKNTTATVVNGRCLGLSMTDSHQKITFSNDAFWKIYFTLKIRVLIALNSKPQRFSKLVVWVISYVPGKCTTVIVVNWNEMGRSMTDRRFRVQSSLFRSLWLNTL
jgi:hypothetical protein